MIKYNNNNINDWYYDSNDIAKVYYNGNVTYQRVWVSPIPPPHTPCYDVTTSISSYTGSMNTVYASDTDKWYKLNNLNEYEEYGLYGSGLSITTYEGKLTINDGYEYIYSGGSWVSVGEVSGSSITIKSPEYIEKNASYGGKIDLDYIFKTNTKIQFKINNINERGGSIFSDQQTIDTNDCRFFGLSSTAYFDYGGGRIIWTSHMSTNRTYEFELGNYYIKDMSTSESITSTTFSVDRSTTIILGLGGNDQWKIYYWKAYDGETLVRDFIPWTDEQGTYGLYDKVSNTVFNTYDGSLTASSVWNDVEVSGGYEYPMYYAELQDPPQNLVFYDIREANNYECPYVGLYATIGGVDYLYCETDEWMTLYDYVEVVGDYICEDGNKYKKLQECERNIDGTLQPLSPPIYVKGDLIEEGSSDCGGYENQYLTFVAETDNVSFTLVGANSSNIFQYSLDNGSTWNNLQIGQTSPSIDTNEKILWKASGLTINQEAGIGTIRPSASARVEGNIMSMCYSDNFSGQTTIPANFQFRKLFSAATFITSSENMVFPATTITKQAYSQMFQGCTAMTVAPKIIGTSAMTWSGDYCWSDMFHSCTSITTAPILPAATLGTAVYWAMFEGCTNLSNVTCLATSKQNNSTQGWLSNVASSGTFTKHPNATIWGSGANGIPNGWTVQDYSE